MSETIKVSAIAKIYARTVINGSRKFVSIGEDLQPQVSQALADLGYNEDGAKLETESSQEEPAGE